MPDILEILEGKQWMLGLSLCSKDISEDPHLSEMFTLQISFFNTYALIPMRTICAAGNMDSFLGPVFPKIYEFRSIKFSDALWSDGYSHIFLQNKVTKMCPKYL